MISGCNLSPLFFCLFISQLGQELNSSGLGIILDNLNLSALLFADDLVIIGKSRQALATLMSKTRTFFHKHRLDISVLKSKIMNHDSSTGKTTFQDFNDLPPLTLENVVFFKYLGVTVSSSPHSFFKNFNETVKKKASAYLSSVLSMTKTGPDRSEMAYMTWKHIALPAILYGSEVMPLTQDTISSIESCQTRIAKFILQVPQSSANVSSNLDAGFEPVWSTLAQRVLLYAHSTMMKPETNWAKKALSEQIFQGSKSPYTRFLLKWKSATNCFGVSADLIKSNVKNSAISHILASKQQVCSSTFAMNCPEETKDWFKLKLWVGDTATSKIIAQFRSCNSRLGNRGPAKNGEYYKLCPLCAKTGITALNNEVCTVLEQIIIFTITPLF